MENKFNKGDIVKIAYLDEEIEEMGLIHVGQILTIKNEPYESITGEVVCEFEEFKNSLWCVRLPVNQLEKIEEV